MAKTWNVLYVRMASNLCEFVSHGNVYICVLRNQFFFFFKYTFFVGNTVYNILSWKAQKIMKNAYFLRYILIVYDLFVLDFYLHLCFKMVHYVFFQFFLFLSFFLLFFLFFLLSSYCTLIPLNCFRS